MFNVALDIICEVEVNVEWTPWGQVVTGLAKLVPSCSRCSMCLIRCWMLFVKWK